MNQLATYPLLQMTADEFLLWPGDGHAQRFQLVDGDVRPMSSASRIHGIIQANLAFLLIGAVRASSAALQVLTEGAVIPPLNPGENVRVPDLIVAPSDDIRGDQVVTNPLILIEIVSQGNGASTRDNVRAYATMATVREIIVVHTARMQAEVYVRAADGHWPADPVIIVGSGRLQLGSVRLDCQLSEAYASTWMTR